MTVPAEAIFTFQLFGIGIDAFAARRNAWYSGWTYLSSDRL